MLTPEIICGAFFEVSVLFAILAMTPLVACWAFFWYDDRKWNKAFEAELTRLNSEAENRVNNHCP